MINIYHPKISTCDVCVSRNLNCARALAFNAMPIISTYTKDDDGINYIIVDCIMFNKKSKDNK